MGYAALIHAYGLRLPLPGHLHAIGAQHKVVTDAQWRVLTPRHAPAKTLEGHLTFALKWEGVDLLVLKRLFDSLPDEEVAELVRRRPTGRYARRAWFLHEWLTGRELDLPDASRGNYVDALDPSMQLAVAGRRSRRHRVNDNLPGGVDFCPLIGRTPLLDELMDLDLSGMARAVLDRVPADIVARAAAFLLIEDSRSSHTIEGERPPQRRIERWGRALGEAGKHPLSLDELLRLQTMVIGDARFVRLGLRVQGGFVGEHDRDTGAPLPSHVSARHQDLPRLVAGLLAFHERAREGLDPVAAAAALAFGFVQIHPFADGNGRIHRYLIHHVLAERGFTPPGIVFPVSAAILRDIMAYRDVLLQYSRPLLDHIRWEPTQDGNVRVLDNTLDLYRYFDATPQAEYLYQRVRATIEEDLPRETSFLQAHDRFTAGVQEIVELPGPTMDLLFRFLRQNRGRLSKRARTKEFRALTGREVQDIEAVYADTCSEL